MNRNSCLSLEGETSPSEWESQLLEELCEEQLKLHYGSWWDTEQLLNLPKPRPTFTDCRLVSPFTSTMTLCNFLEIDKFLWNLAAVCCQSTDYCTQTACSQLCLSRLKDAIGFILKHSSCISSAAFPDIYTKSTVHVVCWQENEPLGSWPADGVHSNIFCLLGRITTTKHKTVSWLSEIPSLLLKLCWSKIKSKFERMGAWQRKKFGSVALGFLHGFRRWEGGVISSTSGFLPVFFLALNCFLPEQERYLILSENPLGSSSLLAVVTWTQDISCGFPKDLPF